MISPFDLSIAHTTGVCQVVTAAFRQLEPVSFTSGGLTPSWSDGLPLPIDTWAEGTIGVERHCQPNQNEYHITQFTITALSAR